MEIEKLIFGWTYASLEDYGNGVPKQFWVLDESGACKRPATPEEHCLVEWLRACDDGTVHLREVEWADAFTHVEDQKGTVEGQLQQRIDRGIPLSELTVYKPGSVAA